MFSLTLRKQLDNFTLDLALNAAQEKIIVLFGASGAGKSLTLAAIAGFITPDAGHIAIGERVLFDSARGIDETPQARRIGMVRQDFALFPHLNAADNIAYGLQNISRAQRSTRVRELLQLVQLENFGARKPAELSGGQQQRVALARALAIEPALLLLDEPFSALDLQTRVELRHQLKTLQHRLRTSIVFVTHDLGEAAFLADEMAILDRGKILQFATPHEILRAPQTARVAEIIGVKNILPATILDAQHIRVGSATLQANTAPFAAGARAMMCVRPERVLLVRREALRDDRVNVLEGDLVHQENDGDTVMLRFRSQGARLQPARDFDFHIDMPLYVYERLQLETNSHWHVSIKPQAIHLVAA